MIDKMEIWTDGDMDLNINGEMKHVYVRPEAITPTYENMKKRLDNGETIKLGFGHWIPYAEIVEPMIKELNLLNVGEFNKATREGNKIYAHNVKFTNPQVENLYQRGLISDLSIHAPSRIDPCPS